MTGQLTLVLATLLCSLVAGLLFGFAVVVMPGIRALEDREFLLAFREMDGVIQRGQPLFGLVWVGSAVALVVGVVLSWGELAGAERALLLGACVAYLVGVQLPTVAVNIPLNNEVQALDVDDGDGTDWRAARERFESRWNRWNRLRTGVAVVVVAVLMVVLLRN